MEESKRKEKRRKRPGAGESEQRSHPEQRLDFSQRVNVNEQLRRAGLLTAAASPDAERAPPRHTGCSRCGTRAPQSQLWFPGSRAQALQL
ncbi:hypothetical protein MJT46_013800 [Ovis ammon polii x Ovis aries]|nr:hypothetical protein MJT46_013800 [Ovis ammon polii x Ovis aries]